LPFLVNAVVVRPQGSGWIRQPTVTCGLPPSLRPAPHAAHDLIKRLTAADLRWAEDGSDQ
jgi:hypothetical protein